LFALIGAQYGGGGKTTFAGSNLPPVKTTNGVTPNYYSAVEGIFPPRDYAPG